MVHTHILGNKLHVALLAITCYQYLDHHYKFSSLMPFPLLTTINHPLNLIFSSPINTEERDMRYPRDIRYPILSDTS